jgi:hypothetical protein
MNRQLARSLGYRYTRLLDISQGTNSSGEHGGESLAVDYSSLGMALNPALNQCEIIYADPADLIKMLDIRTGGFGLEAVAAHHYLFYP